MTTCITHKTIRVRYSAPVARCVRRLRVFPPVSRGAQHVLEVRWRCEPEADRTRERSDDFGNRVLELCHRRIESEFLFAAEIITRIETAAFQTLSSENTLSVAREENLPPAGLTAFLLPSALCDIAIEARRIVQHLQGTGQVAGNDTQRSALRLCAWAHHALQYAPGATDARTPVSQALQRGAGVCQDYTHLMIALCRAARVPARYVSGYSRVPENGTDEAENAGHGGQMHAWVEALCGDNWLAFDPTHNRMVSNNCVFVACGRDYSDVSPVRGSYEGTAEAQLRTRCETRVVG